MIVVLFLLLVLLPMHGWAFLTDNAVHPEPTAPSLPAAGSTATDPVFGSTILRVTDAGDSSGDCATFYSNMPSLNVNNTKIAAQCRVGSMLTKVWDFNAATMTRSNGRLQSNPPDGAQGYFTQWSRTTYNKFTICAKMNLVEVTIPDGTSTTWTNAILHNFSADFPGATYVTQHSVSSDDNVFALMSDTGSYAVWRRSTNSILLKVTNEGPLDEVEIDKSGRYLMALKDNKRLDVWDLQAGPTETQIIPFLFFSHRAMGNGIVGGSCNYSRLCVRNLATPNSVNFLLPRDLWAYDIQQDHFSMPGGSDAWMIATRYSLNGGTVLRAFDSEIVRVATDGSNRVQRVAHHHSVVINNNYNAQPKASASHDGNFIAFTSNWGNPNGRLDLYLVRIEPSGSTTGADTTPPVPPTNITVR